MSRVLLTGVSGTGKSALVATLAANVFYLTMQFYYFYALVLVIVAAPSIFRPRDTVE